MHGLAREAARLHIRSLVIVHFFSSFRRAHDIHHIVDHDQHVHRTGAHLFTISVDDLCLQRRHADLATHQSIAWWTGGLPGYDRGK